MKSQLLPLEFKFGILSAPHQSNCVMGRLAEDRSSRVVLLAWIVGPLYQGLGPFIYFLSFSVISDDSDCVVFGASVVYRHFFRSSKTVEVYAQQQIQETLQFTQQQLVCLALLLGLFECNLNQLHEHFLVSLLGRSLPPLLFL